MHPCSLLVAGPLAVLFTWLPPTDPSLRRWQGAATGALAGAWMAALCVVGCASTDPGHRLAHHLAFVPACALAGLAIARES